MPDGEHLLDRVYDELRAIARHRLAQESPGHTLQPTALVHEVYLKLLNHASIFTSDKSRFMIAAAEAMRRILIDHARTRGRIKRGGRRVKESLSEIADVGTLASDEDPEQIMAMDQAIRRLEQVDEQAAQIVKLRFYAGLSVEDTAAALNVSPRTVTRDWQFARAWLFGALQ